MGLLIGTDDGLYRSRTLEGTGTEQVLDCGRVLRVERFDGLSGVFAATKTGLFHADDEVANWRNLGVPRKEVYSVAASPDGRQLYAGTHPAHLYISGDGGETWMESERFLDLPSREQWNTLRHRNEAHVRSLVTHFQAPRRVIAGVEVGGVHVSDDGGVTWDERRDDVHDDIHHLLATDSDTLVAATGTGLYRTEDGGQSWVRLDTDFDYRYFREVVQFEESLVTASARNPPSCWTGPDGAVAVGLKSTDRGITFSKFEYPGAPEELATAFTVVDGTLVGGTMTGRLFQWTSDGWRFNWAVPTGVRSLVKA